MASDLQHCVPCHEEYVAGVAACAECGGPLQPGPLDRRAARARPGGRADAATLGAAASGRPDRRLAELPGLQADHAVRALLLEGIACGVVCEGVTQVYAPGQPPAQPFAVTLPVTVYVAGAQYEAAQEILASLQHDDMIGDQWSEAAVAENEAVVEIVAADAAEDGEPARADESAAADAPTPESTSLRTIVLVVLAAVVLLFVFGR